MKHKTLALFGICGAMLVAAPAAQARDHHRGNDGVRLAASIVNLVASVFKPAPPPAPVVVAPTPVVVAPTPVVVQPAPVVVAPPPRKPEPPRPVHHKPAVQHVPQRGHHR